MNKPTHRAISAYVQTGVETDVPEADPHRLILMLFEGLAAAIADARMKLIARDIPGRGEAISKALSIIGQGLQPSLNTEKGGELAERLEALYDYITLRLLEANLYARAEALDEAGRLVAELHSAWQGIGSSQVARKTADAMQV